MKETKEIRKDLHIMMGLPGSGKTTYVNNHRNNQKNNDRVESIDEWLSYCRKGESPLKNAAISAAEHLSMFDTKTVWIDGLILTERDINDVVNTFIKKFNSQMKYGGMGAPNHTNVYIHIHQFENNREYCKVNDTKRYNTLERMQGAGITIDNAVYDVLTKEQIEKLTSRVLIEHSRALQWNIEYYIDYELLEVKKCGNWDLYFKQTYRPFHDVKPHNENILMSNTWSLGGSWGDYMGNHGSIEADKQPEFEELDEILLKICPNLPILMYKKIYKEYVDVKETSEHDYYGGCEYKGYYEADMKGIYNYLRENNLIEE